MFYVFVQINSRPKEANMQVLYIFNDIFLNIDVFFNIASKRIQYVNERTKRRATYLQHIETCLSRPALAVRTYSKDTQSLQIYEKQASIIHRLENDEQLTEEEQAVVKDLFKISNVDEDADTDVEESDDEEPNDEGNKTDTHIRIYIDLY